MTTRTARCWCADRVQAGRSCQGDDHHFARVGRAGQGARFDDWRTLRRSDPFGRPSRVRFSPPTSLSVALTDLLPLGPGQNYIDFALVAVQANQLILPGDHRRFSPLPLGHLAGIGLALATTTEAPQKKADLSCGSAQRRRRGAVGLHGSSSVVEITPDAINDWLEVDFEAERAQLHLTGFTEFTDLSFSFVSGIG